MLQKKRGRCGKKSCNKSAIGNEAQSFSSPNRFSPTFLHAAVRRSVQAVPAKPVFPFPPTAHAAPGKQSEALCFGELARLSGELPDFDTAFDLYFLAYESGMCGGARPVMPSAPRPMPASGMTRNDTFALSRDFYILVATSGLHGADGRSRFRPIGFVSGQLVIGRFTDGAGYVYTSSAQTRGLMA